MPPLHMSTTFENTEPGESEYFYGRMGNPTREIFERTIASLEGIEDYENNAWICNGFWYGCGNYDC